MTHDDQDITEIDVLIDTKDFSSKMNKLNNDINKSLKSLSSFSSPFLKVTSKSNGSLPSANKLIEDIAIDLPKCKHCNSKHKKKIGDLLKIGYFICTCGKTKYNAQQKK